MAPGRYASVAVSAEERRHRRQLSSVGPSPDVNGRASTDAEPLAVARFGCEKPAELHARRALWFSRARARAMADTRSRLENRGTNQRRLGVTLFLAAAVVSFLLSIALWFTDNHQEGVFVGLWVPSILAAGGFWMAAVATP
jgi:hypothetical protein